MDQGPKVDDDASKADRMTCDDYVDQLFHILADQVKKLTTSGGWPVVIILRAIEKLYIAMVVAAAITIDDRGKRNLFLTSGLRRVSAQVEEETRKAILRRSIPTTEKKQ